MKGIQLPAFGETDFTDVKTNESARVVVIKDSDYIFFVRYCELFEKNGFTKKESRKQSENSYASFYSNGTGVFINFFDSLNEIIIVTEEKCNYFDFYDKPGDKQTTPQITQIHLEDFGESEVVRLSDGRFIIFDGGWEFEPDMETRLRL